jgi:cytochrome c553
MRTFLIISILTLSFALALPVSTPPTRAAENDPDARVKELWKEHCAQCHGEDGRARTPMGRKLRLLDYTDPKVQEKFTDEEMIKITKEGVRQGNRVLMKPYEDELSEKEIKELVAYIRKFNREKK